MKNEQEQYDELLKEQAKITLAIEELKKDPKVRKYDELLKGKKRIDLSVSKFDDKFLKERLLKEYRECNHVLVTTSIAGENCPRFGCIKCGVDETVMEIINNETRSNDLGPKVEAMKEYFNTDLESFEHIIGTNLGICYLDNDSFNEAQREYKKIKEENNDNDSINKQFIELYYKKYIKSHNNRKNKQLIKKVIKTYY